MLWFRRGGNHHKNAIGQIGIGTDVLGELKSIHFGHHVINQSHPEWIANLRRPFQFRQGFKTIACHRR